MDGNVAIRGRGRGRVRMRMRGGARGGRGVGRRRGRGRLRPGGGLGQRRRGPNLSDEIQATLVDHVVNHGDREFSPTSAGTLLQQ